jgi:trk system potassium uptake protein
MVSRRGADPYPSPARASPTASHFLSPHLSMKIIILGAGQVGASVATTLAAEHNDITLVDHAPSLLRALQDRLDLKTVHGYAAHPDILAAAGAKEADMILAVTNNDETNMVACQVAHTLFKVPTKIARVRALAFAKYPQLFSKEALPIDVIISPEQLVTQHLLRLIENPGALQVLDFAEGKVRLVGVRAREGGRLVGKELLNLFIHRPEVDARVAAIYRHGRAIHPTGKTVIEADDEVFFIAATPNIPVVMAELRREEPSNRRIMLAGGGNIGRRLAQELQNRYEVKLIERDEVQVARASEALTHTVVIHGSSADEERLKEERVENADVFCAITNDDEANILSAMLAKRLGARKVMALINRAAYVELVESGPIDVAISPHQATVSSLLTHVRRGDVVRVHSLRRGAAEAIEAVAHGDRNASKVVGRSIEEIHLPKGATIGALVRGDQVLIAHHDTVIESGDHVILFLVDKGQLAEVERLFQVSFMFL